MTATEHLNLTRLLDYPPIASCLIQSLVEIDEHDKLLPPTPVTNPSHEKSQSPTTGPRKETLASLPRLVSWYKRLIRPNPDPTRMTLHQLYTLAGPITYPPTVSGKSAATRTWAPGAVWPLARTCKTAHDELAVELYRTWRVGANRRGEVLASGMSPRARECIRKLTVEGGPKDDSRAVWLQPFLQSCTRLKDLSVELVGPSRRLTLPPRCIPSSTRHVYWDDPSAPQISMLLAYRSITLLTMSFDVDMPSMASPCHLTLSKIKDLGQLGVTDPRQFSRTGVCADPDDIISWFHAACALPGQILFYIDDPWETTQESRLLREMILRLRWNGPPERLLASEFAWLWMEGDGPVVVKFAADHNLKRYRKAHRAYEGGNTAVQEHAWWVEVNKVEDAWAALGLIEARPPRGVETEDRGVSAQGLSLTA